MPFPPGPGDQRQPPSPLLKFYLGLVRAEDDPEARRLHRVALARELTAMADVPLRDRHWLAIPDEEVWKVVDTVASHVDDAAAVAALDDANIRGDIEIAQAYYRPCDVATLYRIVAALRPLADDDFALARFRKDEARG